MPAGRPMSSHSAFTACATVTTSVNGASFGSRSRMHQSGVSSVPTRDDQMCRRIIANMAAILLHIWSSRVGTLETPDWCILDLDPKEAPFTDVVTVAQAVKALCDDIGLPAGVKTSGSTGLHVLIPLGRQVTYQQSRTLGGLLARVIAAELPAIATVTRQVQKRGGKVYLDYAQNGHGRLLVAP